MKKSLMLTALLLTSVVQAEAINVQLAWTAPVAREDGSAFKVTDIESYYVVIDGLPEVKTREPIMNRQMESGAHTFVVRVCDINSLCSRYSEVKSFNLVSAPKPPTTLFIKII